jgi:hypothetical protein
MAVTGHRHFPAWLTSWACRADNEHYVKLAFPPARAGDPAVLLLSCLTEVGPEWCCGTSFGETSRIRTVDVSLNLVPQVRMSH